MVYRTKKNTNIYICCSPNKPLRKSMRRNIPAIFAISALVILILCSGCAMPGSETPVNAGLSQITTPEISSYISFEEAKQKFEDYNTNGSSSEKLPVFYLFSRDVDGSGNALTWLFGVREGTETKLLMYDRTGWKTIPWSATFPSEEIMLNQVVSPNTLFSQNSQAIRSTSSPSVPERRDLVLKQGRYTLTINSNNTSRTLTFDATSGALITDNV